MKITICMNVSRFMNLAAIFSLDLESQYIWTKFRWKSVLLKIFSLSGFLIKQLCIFNWQTQDLLLGNCLRAKTWIKSLLVEIARLGRRRKPGCFAASNYFPDTMYYFPPGNTNVTNTMRRAKHQELCAFINLAGAPFVCYK